MIHPPISLEDSVVAFSGDSRATPLPRTRARRAAMEDARILGTHAFNRDTEVHADYWECHPAGDEVLVVLEGCIHAAVELDGGIEEAVIDAGHAFIVPRARWHRLRVLKPGRLLFFSPTAGSRLRRHDGEQTGIEAHEALTMGRNAHQHKGEW